MSWPPDIDTLTARDVMHARPSTLPATASDADLKRYFDESSSHRLAVLANGDRFAGAVFCEDANLTRNTTDVIGPNAPATEARDRALAAASRRLPVVDDDGTLVGLIAITKHRDGFCG